MHSTISKRMVMSEVLHSVVTQYRLMEEVLHDTGVIQNVFTLRFFCKIYRNYQNVFIANLQSIPLLPEHTFVIFVPILGKQNNKPFRYLCQTLINGAAKRRSFQRAFFSEQRKSRKDCDRVSTVDD